MEKVTHAYTTTLEGSSPLRRREGLADVVSVLLPGEDSDVLHNAGQVR